MRRAILADVHLGAVVRIKGRWGVVCLGHARTTRARHRIVDFWDGGREMWPVWTEVEL